VLVINATLLPMISHGEASGYPFATRRSRVGAPRPFRSDLYCAR
jgi:hypothetical protein